MSTQFIDSLTFLFFEKEKHSHAKFENSFIIQSLYEALLSRKLESIYIIKQYIITLFIDYHEFELEITRKNPYYTHFKSQKGTLLLGLIRFYNETKNFEFDKL